MTLTSNNGATITPLGAVSGTYRCPVCRGNITTKYLSDRVYMFGCYNKCPVNPMVFQPDAEMAQMYWEILSADLERLKEAVKSGEV